MRQPFTFILFLVFLISCTKKINVTATSGENPASADLDVNQIISLVNNKAIKANYIQGKGQVSLDDGGFLSSGTITLRSAKDSLIWFSITKLGFEVARGLIRTDSAFAINNWENTYWKGSLPEISEKYNVPAEFGDLESILIPTLDKKAQYQVNKNASGYQLQEQGTLNKKYDVSIPELLINTLLITQASADFKVSYSDYSDKNGFWFPYTQTHMIRKDNQVHQTKIRFNSMEVIDKINTPFTIPHDFTPIN
ncbi:MAG: DUF4292 domain-containing protein [Saprospiraceae bacterium]